MTEVTLILPHQLFEEHPCLDKDRPVILWEHPLFFSQYKFHKQKLILHRASMKKYQAWLEQNKYSVSYIEFDSELPKINKIHLCHPSDDWVMQGLEKYDLEITKGPDFFWTDNFEAKPPYRMASFYIKQRKTLKILVDKQGNPKGGKWSYDAENRKKLPKNHQTPELPQLEKDEYLEEAIKYVEQYFGDNPGQYEQFIYPTGTESAKAWLQTFLKERIHDFGAYEDAIEPNEAFLYHSILSPLINIGLLTPAYVVKETLKFAQKNEVPLASLEGFIRQIIGWREFIHEIYLAEGRKQRCSNFFKHKRKLPKSFWGGRTGLPPFDKAFKRLEQYAYCHHIERLMVFGNLMNLCEIEPDEVYEWFMSYFIDAYDWVMVPNVYGMTLHADGGLMTTKPYISGSNYIRKMSHYPKGEWTDTWDGLYWNFIQNHLDFFKGNPRLQMMPRMWEKMDETKKATHLKNAKTFL